jgi:ketopantoate hydroxymethyltransferase
VIEAVPEAITAAIVARLRIPRFVQQYAALFEPMVSGVRAYALDVRSHRFPTEAHIYKMELDQLAQFRARFDQLRVTDDK